MTSINPGTVVVSDDAKLALADAASAAARHNRPRYLLFAGVLLIGGAAIYAAVAFAARASASGDLAGQQELTTQVRAAVNALLALRSDEATQVNSPRYTPDLRVLARLEQLGTESGLTGITYSDTEDMRSAPPGMQRKKYTATMNNVDGEAMVRWITRAVAEIQGLEVSMLQLNPGAATPEGKARWSGQVIFTRWERKG
ncbi:MAG: hypothetical protein JNJ48_08720 [Phycisphaerae bacterium]|nr:hypothetical protein [Phycisphaerae bacterium]